MLFIKESAVEYYVHLGNDDLKYYFHVLRVFAQADMLLSGAMDAWGGSNGQFTVRRLLFCDPGLMMDWIDARNATTPHRDDYGTTVLYDAPQQPDELTLWRNR